MFPENLLGLARFQDRGQLRALSGIRAALNVRDDGQAKRIKAIREKNKISHTSKGVKRKQECISSGPRTFENSVKRFASWKDTAENKAVPQNSRLITDEFFKFLLLPGESSRDVTLTYPDNRNDS